MAREDAFDYVVIGSGASGSVVANRLSADPDTTVLVLEAGMVDDDPLIESVGSLVRLWGSERDWQFSTTRQEGMQGREISISQGKTLGGSTSIHAMMYVRGNRRNFDQWHELGNEGWSYSEVLPLFKRLEDFEGGASEYHGEGGPLYVRDCPDPYSRSEVFMSAAMELGYDGPNWDYDGERQENGAGLLHFTIDREGRRVSAASAYLKPAMQRANLTVRTSALVTRLILDGQRVTGVEYLLNGETRQARAEREVIVCAGALSSPKLLMLSGIGPAGQLEALDIPIVADLPGVGQNLQDHLQLIPVAYRAKVDAPLPELLTGNVLFVRTAADEGPPDLQLNFTPSVPRPLAQLMDFGGPAAIFLPILVQPESSGEVRLRSTDPFDAPHIDPNYLARDRDLQVFRSALDLIRSLASTKAFAECNGEELAPGKETDLDAYIRAQSSTLWHPAGTCRMGRDALAVVDPQLRVRGVQGLRVADASVMPKVTSGNTQAACFMIGEKASEMIARSD